MIDSKQFYTELEQREFTFFTGVPDSTLKDFTACLTDSCNSKSHITAANEGGAVAIGAGYHFSTGRFPAVYMQNSGLGNAVNPLVSLADSSVCKIPMLLIIGWRGAAGQPDEPQHIRQGELTQPLLELLGIPSMVLDRDYTPQLDACVEHLKTEGTPIALLVKPGSFSGNKQVTQGRGRTVKREDAIRAILKNTGNDDVLVATTGGTSRELFELREELGMGHDRDFLVVGSMGHAASLALGMSLYSSRNIYCLDGDGAFIMHMGGGAVLAQSCPDNLKYILLNNGVHDSVGGQPTVGLDVDMAGVLRSMGFDRVEIAGDLSAIADSVKWLWGKGKNALIIEIATGSRKDLGRPTVSPRENKQLVMNFLRGSNEEGTDI